MRNKNSTEISTWFGWWMHQHSVTILRHFIRGKCNATNGDRIFAMKIRNNDTLNSFPFPFRNCNSLGKLYLIVCFDSLQIEPSVYHWNWDGGRPFNENGNIYREWNSWKCPIHAMDVLKCDVIALKIAGRNRYLAKQCNANEANL